MVRLQLQLELVLPRESLIPKSALAVLSPIEHRFARLCRMVLDSCRPPIPGGPTAGRSRIFSPGTGSFRTGPLSKAVIQEYRAELDLLGFAASTINVRLAALNEACRLRTPFGRCTAQRVDKVQSCSCV
jgi:hypothetical protein